MYIKLNILKYSGMTGVDH